MEPYLRACKMPAIKVNMEKANTLQSFIKEAICPFLKEFELARILNVFNLCFTRAQT